MITDLWTVHVHFVVRCDGIFYKRRRTRRCLAVTLTRPYSEASLFFSPPAFWASLVLAVFSLEIRPCWTERGVQKMIHVLPAVLSDPGTAPVTPAGAYGECFRQPYGMVVGIELYCLTNCKLR